jgi:hypothetical protein
MSSALLIAVMLEWALVALVDYLLPVSVSRIIVRGFAIVSSGTVYVKIISKHIVAIHS